jgi:hypothetical protein
MSKEMPDEGLPISPPGGDEDDADRWKTDPFLHQLVTVNQGRYQRLAKELVTAGAASTDPKITARAAQLLEIEIQHLVLTGKKKLAK